MIGITVLYSCEKNPLHTSSNDFQPGDNIFARWITDCEECLEIDDCCCGVELQFTTESASLRICGTSDGASLCSFSMVPSPCSSTISGGGQSTTLNSSNVKDGFCLVPGNSFSITNFHSTASANIYVTCLFDETNGQRLTITIPPTETWFFDSDGNCEIARCQ